MKSLLIKSKDFINIKNTDGSMTLKVMKKDIEFIDEIKRMIIEEEPYMIIFNKDIYNTINTDNRNDFENYLDNKDILLSVQSA